MPSKLSWDIAIGALVIGIIFVVIGGVNFDWFSSREAEGLETELRAAQAAGRKAGEELAIARGEVARLREANRQLEITVDGQQRILDSLDEQARRDRATVEDIERILDEGEGIIDALISYFENRAP